MKYKLINNDSNKVLIVFQGITMSKYTIENFYKKNLIEKKRESDLKYSFFKILKEEFSDYNILFIADVYQPIYGYYLFNNKRLINSKLENELNELVKGYSEVNIIGASKGGFAALYYGMRLDVDNIITFVPQININKLYGSNKIYNNIFKEINDNKAFNDEIKNFYNDLENYNKTIHIVTHKKDDYYNDIPFTNKNIKLNIVKYDKVHRYIVASNYPEYINEIKRVLYKQDIPKYKMSHVNKIKNFFGLRVIYKINYIKDFFKS